ncbi:hypothetical protein SAMN04489712_105254 [Thermomonospora echinospora]|uniref:Uncharacterized protein n=1 Tax=Thermomonospora echinospora TaxID=1992 RepID=A0A1H6A8V8_9ACTN|nr:hypothetical protein SAMN04489712_105254 [Thermomonospora echinospora]
MQLIAAAVLMGLAAAAIAWAETGRTLRHLTRHRDGDQ